VGGKTRIPFKNVPWGVNVGVSGSGDNARSGGSGSGAPSRASLTVLLWLSRMTKPLSVFKILQWSSSMPGTGKKTVRSLEPPSVVTRECIKQEKGAPFL
jgi:hypothetical protein